jgi:predicted Zn finger-like uncharacterized protein
MYTQCPYCNTLFRVRVEQLRTARGKAHCSRCDSIFNALENLQDTAPAEKDEWPSSLFADADAPSTPSTPSTPATPESPSEEIYIGSVEDLQDSTHTAFGSVLDFSSDPFPESDNINLDLGEIDPELGGIGSDFGETTPDLRENGSDPDELERSLEETESDLTELESELEDLVSELDELEAESEQHISLPDDPKLSHPESDSGVEATAEEPEVGETTEVRLERLASQLGMLEPEEEAEEEADYKEIEDLVSELDELEAESEQHLSLPGEPVSTPPEFETGYATEAETEEPEVGESTETRLEDLAHQLEELEPEEDNTEIEELVSELHRQEETPDSDLAESMSQPDNLGPETERIAAYTETGVEEAAPLSVGAGEDLAAEEFSQEEPITLEAALAAEEGRKKGRAFWTLGSIVLILVVIGQSSWLGRQQLMRYHEGRVLLETVCTVARCTVPARRAPKQFRVLSRSIISHLEVENALQINLTFVNRADFPQPLPLLDIVLYNLEKKPVVGRRFSPVEYLGRKPGKGELLQPGQALEVAMEIEDPGKDVTGFKLDFF